MMDGSVSMDDTHIAPEGPLTWELLREISPVANSDRRKNADLFVGMVEGRDLRDDAVFYTTLLTQIRQDSAFLEQFDQRFLSAQRGKEARKSPTLRIIRWLCQQSADPDVNDLEGLLDAPVTLFRSDGAAYELHMMIHRVFGLIRAQDNEGGPAQDAEDDKEMRSADWQAELVRLRNLVDEFEVATLPGAEAIVAAAHALLAACTDREAVERLATEQDRAALCAALDAVAQEEPAIKLLATVELIKSDTLSKLRPLVEELFKVSALRESSRTELAKGEADIERLQREKAWASLAVSAAALEALQRSDAEQRQTIIGLLDQMQAIAGTEAVAPEAVSSAGSEHPGEAKSEVAENSPMPASPAPAKAPQLDQVTPPAAPKVVPAIITASRPEQAEHPASSNNSADLKLDMSAVEDVRTQPQAGDAPSGAPASTAEDSTGKTPVALGQSVDFRAAGQPAERLDTLVASYLDRGEAALAWHLASLAEGRGMEIGVPSATLLTLAAAPCVTGPYDSASAAIGEALAEAVAALERCEQEGDGAEMERARALTFAALLRPAVLAPDTSARDHLAHLSMSGNLAAFAPLQKTLAELGHDFQPQLEDLREMGGAERERRTPAASAALRDWITQARSSQSVHQPTTVILHTLTAPSGTFGKAVEAALADRPGADKATREFLESYRLRAALERLIADSEREIGRPMRDRIRGMALFWIYRKLQEGCERLQDLLDARTTDRGILDDRRKQILQRQVGALRKVLDALPVAVPTKEGEPLDDASRREVLKAISALRCLLDGADVGAAPRRVSEALRLPLLRLPAVSQPNTPGDDGTEFAKERAVQQENLFRALQSPEISLAADERAALKCRLAEDALLPAAELLEQLRHTGALKPAEVAEAIQELQERGLRARREIGEQIEALRLELATLYNIDLRTGERLRQALEQLDAIGAALAKRFDEDQLDDEQTVSIPARAGQRRPGIPPDFPQVRVLLADVRALRDQVREEIARDQMERLERIVNDHPGMAEAVGDIISTLSSRDPTTVEDIIASLQAGQPVSGLESEAADSFGLFFPGFVDALATPTEELNRGRIDKALQEGSVLGPLDFSQLDEDGRRGAKQLLECWRQVENSLRQTTRDVRDPVRQVVEALGFTAFKVQNELSLIPGKLRVISLRCAAPEADNWFLPPDFGSVAKGGYRLFLCNPAVPDDQIGSELSKSGVDMPSLLLMFGLLSRQRRVQLALRMRAKKQRVLLIDETQILFLATRAVSRLQTLFSCAAPFGYVQPYTTDPGNIPREMFFGRKDEIARIQACSADGCLVYGGRQLGKSALLNHVRKIYHRPEEGLLVCYRSCDTIGGPSDPAASIWRVIAGELALLNVLDRSITDAEKVVEAINRWLGSNPARRILMLLDETDQFMSAEARSGYPNLTRLKELMIQNTWRFKVVFAGLHNVRRAWKAPNTPLAHLGDPICVGPLNTTPDNRAEARRLVVEPMRAAGFEYESSSLGWDILARVNHYPSLVQVFCKELLTDLYRKPQPQGAGPRWRIGRVQIFEGVGYRQIATAIRSKFRLTLDLDPRYDLVAHVLALHRLDNGDEEVLRTGLTVGDLHEEVIGYWPDSLERLDRAAFAALLDEMVDLGVLSRFGPQQDRYSLRTAQVALMLGGRREVEAQIEQIMSMEPRVDYDPALFFRRLAPDDATRRAPLSDRQLEALFDPARPGQRIVAASPALWGVDISGALASLARSWGTEGPPREAVVLSGGLAEFRKAVAVGAQGQRPRVIVIPPEAQWSVEWVDWCAKQGQVKAGRVLPVFVAPLSWLRDLHLSNVGRASASVFLPQPWGNQMLRAFLAETDNALLDHASRRAKLIEGSGGVPALLTLSCAELAAACRAGEQDPDEVIAAWCERQKLAPEHVGLSPELVPFLRELDNVKPDDFDLLKEILRDAWSGSGAAPDTLAILGLFADLGLIASSDSLHEGVRITALGRLVKRSLSRQ